MRARMVVVAALLATVTTSAEGARLSGTVRLRGAEPIQASVDPYPAQLGSMPMHSMPAPGERDVALVLTPRDSKAQAATPRREIMQMAQEGQAFAPRVLAIPVGSAVEFPNFDPVFHNVFSYSKTKKFDLGRYGSGSSKSVTFDKSGVVKVFCDIHSNMSGFIYVAASPLVTQPDADGRYSFESVTPGRYEMTIWHPDRGETVREVVIGEADQTFDLEL